jgi:hypothetical protein
MPDGQGLSRNLKPRSKKVFFFLITQLEQNARLLWIPADQDTTSVKRPTRSSSGESGRKVFSCVIMKLMSY